MREEHDWTSPWVVSTFIHNVRCERLLYVILCFPMYDMLVLSNPYQWNAVGGSITEFTSKRIKKENSQNHT